MILDQINEDFKLALKSKDEVSLSALRNLKAEISNAQIEKRSELNEEEILSVIKKKVKQHKDSITEFKAGNREDLVQREEAQMNTLNKYLPEQMSEDQVKEIVRAVIDELKASKSDFGKVIKEVIMRANGATDGNVVSKIVKEALS